MKEYLNEYFPLIVIFFIVAIAGFIYDIFSGSNYERQSSFGGIVQKIDTRMNFRSVTIKGKRHSLIHYHGGALEKIYPGDSLVKFKEDDAIYHFTWKNGAYEYVRTIYAYGNLFYKPQNRFTKLDTILNNAK